MTTSSGSARSSAFRPQGRTAPVRPWWRWTALATLLALVASLGLTHSPVHAGHGGWHGSAGLEFAGSETDLPALVQAPGAADDHDATRCALCRARDDSRTQLPRVALPTWEVTVGVRPAAALPVSHARIDRLAESPAAPRAPPIA